MKQKDVAAGAIPQTPTVSYYHVILRKTSYTYFEKPKRVQASREKEKPCTRRGSVIFSERIISKLSNLKMY